MSKQWWVGVAGPEDELELPESPNKEMWKAVRRGYMKVTGKAPYFLETGWGVSKQQAKVIRTISKLPEDSPIIQYIEDYLHFKLK